MQHRFVRVLRAPGGAVGFFISRFVATVPEIVSDRAEISSGGRRLTFAALQQVPTRSAEHLYDAACGFCRVFIENTFRTEKFRIFFGPRSARNLGRKRPEALTPRLAEACQSLQGSAEVLLMLGVVRPR